MREDLDNPRTGTGVQDRAGSGECEIDAVVLVDDQIVGAFEWFAIEAVGKNRFTPLGPDHANLVYGWVFLQGRYQTAFRVEADSARAVRVAQKCGRVSLGIDLADAALQVIPVEQCPVRHADRAIRVFQPIDDNLNSGATLDDPRDIRRDRFGCRRWERNRGVLTERRDRTKKT